MTIPTPCIRICVIDTGSALCEGCGRTLAEIAAWGTMDDGARLDVMALLPQRLASRRAASTSAPADPISGPAADGPPPRAAP